MWPLAIRLPSKQREKHVFECRFAVLGYNRVTSGDQNCASWAASIPQFGIRATGGNWPDTGCDPVSLAAPLGVISAADAAGPFHNLRSRQTGPHSPPRPPFRPDRLTRLREPPNARPPVRPRPERPNRSHAPRPACPRQGWRPPGHSGRDHRGRRRHRVHCPECRV